MNLPTSFRGKEWCIVGQFLVIVILAIALFFWRKDGFSCASQKTYTHLNPRVVCQVADEEERDRITLLEERVKKIITEKKNIKEIDEASVFFRDLGSLRWFSVNPHENYSPGSTLKLPILVAYLKMSEAEPKVLDQEFVYKSEGENLNDLEYFRPSVEVQAGNRYSVRELLRRMMVYSDNETTVPLLNTIGDEYLSKVLRDLGVYFPTTAGSETEFLSAPMYGAIFRTLYNASYLSRENSEFALRLMEEAEFSRGLVAGADPESRVSHKFGERTIKLSDGTLYRQLHDCGIVYKKDPNKAYIICVMTKGNDFTKLATTIKEISQLVYREE